MTAEVEMYVVEDLRAPALQLHIRPGADAYCALFGWDVSPPLVDGGPPPILQEVFAAALVQCGTLSFLATPRSSGSSSGWFAMGEDHWLRLPATGVDWLRRRSLPWVMATDNPERARMMFSSTASWENQHQVGFLLERGKFPILERRLVVDLMGARDAEIAGIGWPNEVVALALPAVDGDFLEIVARNPSMRETIRAAIATECSRRDVPFSSRQALS